MGRENKKNISVTEMQVSISCKISKLIEVRIDYKKVYAIFLIRNGYIYVTII